MSADLEARQPDTSLITDGPHTGLPKWVLDLRSMFLSYGQQISELTAYRAELEFAISNILQEIINNHPEELGKQSANGPDPETAIELAARLIRDYRLLKDQHEPMVARLAAAEKRLQFFDERQDV